VFIIYPFTPSGGYAVNCVDSSKLEVTTFQTYSTIEILDREQLKDCKHIFGIWISFPIFNNVPRAATRN